MATHSSIFAWRTPWTEEAGGLQSMGSQRVGHDWSALATAAAAEGKEGEHFSKCDLATVGAIFWKQVDMITKPKIQKLSRVIWEVI